MLRFTILVLTLAVADAAHGQNPRAADAAAADAPAATTPQRIATEHLPNAVQVHPRVISGGLPEGEAGFRELCALGVKTVISVDGAKPDVATAQRYGLRYVHLPHGYDGIPSDRVGELAKAVRDLPGPVYIHCHHGKHRSPAAASVACVVAGLLPSSQGRSVLELAGTSPHYRGLYQAADDAQSLDKGALDAVDARFPETMAVPPMAEAMVAIEHTHDNLKTIAAARWRTPPEHPDLEPAHEALLMREHFTELLRSPEAKQQAEGFREMLRQSEADATILETALRQWHAASEPSDPPQQLDAAAQRITANCKACHQQYRDVPLTEKTQR